VASSWFLFFSYHNDARSNKHQIRKCESEELKNQLDATYYFTVLLIGSTCFGHYYAHQQELATIMLITTSNYQSTNETHYTQQNTTITTHKGSQLLKLTETHYQLQPSDKQLHTEHTPLRTIILH